ncbi:hypothetical protein [Senegalia massiliensis]|nr:hypothetical protein [Senegalia massiliensis]
MSHDQEISDTINYRYLIKGNLTLYIEVYNDVVVKKCGIYYFNKY